jgi:hypothetical protein
MPSVSAIDAPRQARSHGFAQGLRPIGRYQRGSTGTVIAL